MSRGGRGGARGGKRGPDLSWQDEDPEDESSATLKNVPGPLFPVRHIPTPKPLSAEEKASVQAQLRLRERIRNGPLYTVFEPSVLLDDKGKANLRAGFDPFNDQERFTKRYHRRRRVVPDLSERGGYTLRLFPAELWPVLDPKKRQKEYWDTLSDEVKARITGSRSATRGTKRKRNEKLRFDDSLLDHAEATRNSDNEDQDDEDDDVVSSTRRNRTNKTTTTSRRRRTDSAAKQAKQKKGLDAEDDYPDADPQNDDDNNAAGAKGDNDGADVAEDEPEDSEFGTEDEDDGGDDYNAERYFDDGEGDDFGDADDGDDGGGGGERDYY